MIPKTPFQYQLWIGGKEVPSGSGKKFERKSPAHGTLVGEYARADAPLLIVSQKLPFALAAGCTCVVKPSELTSGTTLRLGRITIQLHIGKKASWWVKAHENLP